MLIAAYSNAVGAGTLFISRRAAPEEAQALADRYSAFVLENGGAVADGGALELFGRFEAVASAGSDLFGVHEATSAEWARAQMAILRAHVEGGPDASP